MSRLRSYSVLARTSWGVSKKPKKKIKSRGAAGKRRANDEAIWRKIVRERAGGLCQICGLKGSTSHHLLTRGAFPEHRTNPANGIYLCAEPCHREAHEDMSGFIDRWAEQSAEFAEFLSTARRIEK